MSAQAPNNMSDSSSSFLLPYKGLKFFSRIRRFLYSHTVVSKRSRPSNRPEKSITTEEEKEEEMEARQSGIGEGGVVMQRSVKKLHFGSWQEKEEAAEEIKRLAGGGVKARKSLAELGVIPALASMVGSEAAGRRRLALQALIELANGTVTNKALMLEAGILTKLPHCIDEVDEATRGEFAHLLLSLTSLSNSQFPLSSSKIVPFLLSVLESSSTSFKTKDSCLATLCNLSTMLDTATILVTTGTVGVLLRMALVKEVSEKALAALGNLVVTLMGKKALETNEMMPESLIEVMTWEEKPKCQELCAYILMVLAHQSSAQRQKMAQAGIVPVLLEVALLGSPLAQKRALKLLQWFKDERQTKIGPHSGPQIAQIAVGLPPCQRDSQEGKRMMKNMVRQSLHKNMEVITRRASGVHQDPPKMKALIVSSSSKSLPY